MVIRSSSGLRYSSSRRAILKDRLMVLSNIARWVQQADTRWQRRINPGRCVLVNARTAMNYSVIAPICREMHDPRVSFFFTASEKPAAVKTVYREIGDSARIISTSRAGLMKFDAYVAADLLWLTLPRGAK